VNNKVQKENIEIPIDGKKVYGDLDLIKDSKGIVLFAYGSGSSRFSPRERFVSDKLNEVGISTLFMDLLTKEEESVDEETREYRFNIPLLAERLENAILWAKKDSRTKNMKMGLFGGSTGASACLIASEKYSKDVDAVISRGGRTDLADEQISRITAATLFIVGGDDTEILELNENSFKLLKCKNKKLEIIPGATHLFEEPGKLDEVADLSAKWFIKYLK
jgi:putative phosphoribosyl transferase